jgi:hypothetical protein
MYRKLYKTNSSKKKVETALLPKDSVLELINKNVDNSLIFLTITYTTPSAKWFRCYGILTIDIAAEFCFWTEQRQNGSSISSLILAKTPEVPNTVSVDNSLSFPMVH